MSLTEGPTAEAIPMARAVAGEMRGELDALAASITDVIHHNCPDLPNALRDGTYSSTLANIDAFTTVVHDGLDPATITPPDDAKVYARRFARGGLDMELLTRAYRYGEHAYRTQWRDKLRQTSPDADLLTAATAYVEDGLFQYISSVTRSLSTQHAAEQERSSSPGAILRLNEVRHLLDGDAVDPLVSSPRLRYRLDGPHTAFVLWYEGAGPAPDDPVTELAGLAAAIGAALGATNTLALELGDVFAGWANVDAALPDPGPELPDGVHLAVGLSHRGPDGFRRSHAEALQARRVHRLGAPGAGPAHFGELALDALLTTDLAEARRFVARELGDLADPVGPRQRLVETLEAYLLAGSSMARVSRQLGVHENTVAYRVRRAEEILGRRIDQHQLELQAALRLSRLLRAGRPAGSVR